MFVKPIWSMNKGRPISGQFCEVAIKKGEVFLLHYDPCAESTEIITWENMVRQVESAVSQSYEREREENQKQ